MATKKKTGFQQVADVAGVGIATVDRVLNERGNTSLEATRKVLEAARQLGLNRILPRAYRKLTRIEVLLARPELPLISRMNQEFQRLSARIDRSVVVQRTILGDEEPETIAAAIRRTTCDGVIVYAPEHALIHAAIAEARARDVPTVTMISDLPHSDRLAYAGIDHYKAGRTAAYFLAGMVGRRGPLLILCSHFAVLGHAERIRGCTDCLAENSNALSITEILEGHDQLELSETLLRAALKRRPDTVAIYNAGAANRAVTAAIDGAKLETKPIFIGHELTENTRAMLRSGLMTLAIDQNPEQQARSAVDVLLHHFGFVEANWMTVPYVPNTSFTLYGPENVPAG